MISDGDPGWTATEGLESNMIIAIYSAKLNGIPVQNGKVAAFDALSNECRGVETFFDGGGLGQAYMLVGFTGQTGQAFYYKVWDSDVDLVYEVVETGSYAPDGFVEIDLTLIPGVEPLITFTDGNGDYIFEDIPDGTYTVCTGVTVATDGYIDECAEGTVTTPPSAVVDFALAQPCCYHRFPRNT